MENSRGFFCINDSLLQGMSTELQLGGNMMINARDKIRRKVSYIQNFIGAVCYYAFTHENYFQIYTEFWPVVYKLTAFVF